MSEALNELVADVRERVLLLRELGVDALDVELPEILVRHSSEAARFVPPVAVGESQISNLKSEILKPNVERPAAGSRLASLPSLSARPIAAAIRNGQTPGTGATVSPVSEEREVLFDIAPTLPEPVETIEQIRAEIGPVCARCTLCAGRTQVVHSTGNFNARLMFVGEAPGADEDEQGFPFVGRAGQLLTKIIEGIGINREDVFIGNINRCRPPGNRQPVPAETAACRPFLLREVAVVRPKVIVVLGNTATQNLLDIKTPISKLRGNFQDYFGVKVMPTFHPAYLLRDPHKKREVWEDMKMVRDYLNS